MWLWSHLEPLAVSAGPTEVTAEDRNVTEFGTHTVGFTSWTGIVTVGIEMWPKLTQKESRPRGSE